MIGVERVPESRDAQQSGHEQDEYQRKFQERAAVFAAPRAERDKVSALQTCARKPTRRHVIVWRSEFRLRQSPSPDQLFATISVAVRDRLIDDGIPG